MKKRYVLTLVACLLGAGCTQYSAPELSRYSGEPLQISAEATPGVLDAEYRVFINGDMVIKKRSKTFGGTSQNFTGRWRGKRVLARATRVQNFLSAYTQIDVFIDGQLVETLTV